MFEKEQKIPEGFTPYKWLYEIQTSVHSSIAEQKPRLREREANRCAGFGTETTN